MEIIVKTRGKGLKKIKNPGRDFFNRPYYADERALEGTKNKQILKTEQLQTKRGKIEKKSS